MAHRRRGTDHKLSNTYIRYICSLYGDRYDDRLEDSKPPTAGKKKGKLDKRPAGIDWEPGIPAGHKSLSAFQKELAEKHGIRLSTSKIRKILISGGLWSTERSREVQELYTELTQDDSGVNPEQAVSIISRKLGVSKPTVVVNLPYINGINRLEEKSKNAKRCAKYRKKKQGSNGETTNQTEITKL